MIDIPLKKLLKQSFPDWVRFLLPTLQNPEIQELPTEMEPCVQSKLDFLVSVNNEFILHIEPQGYREEGFPERMMRYAADIGATRIKQKLPILPIIQVAVFFRPGHDNGRHCIRSEYNGELISNYSYKVVRIWEIDWRFVIANKLTGLYSLIPFMRREPGDTPEFVFQEAVHAIKTVDTPLMAHEFCGIMVLLCKNDFPKEFFRRLIMKEELFGSEFLSEIFNETYGEELEKGKMEARMEGRMEGERKSMIRVARKMYKSGAPIEDISNITNLPSKKIISLVRSKS